MYGVIIAGGSGSRFWPRSRENNPKQLLKIVGSGTMIQNTVQRLLPVSPIEKIRVVTQAVQAGETCRQLNKFGLRTDQLLAEPQGRNTAPAIAFAARVLAEENPEEVMGVFPADHVIRDPEPFILLLRQAKAIAAAGNLVTLGITPTRPETGYGYIKQGEPLKRLPGAFHVEKFVEKPDEVTARKYLDEGGYHWNCGVFIGKVSVWLEEIKTHLPDIYDWLDDLVKCLNPPSKNKRFRELNEEGREIFELFPNISIDYGVLEKSTRVVVIPTDIQWSDVGSWDALDEIAEKDEYGNVLSHNVAQIDCTDSIIQADERLVAAVGVHNLIIVDTPDALLVAPKERAQDVKRVVEKLRKEGRIEVKTTRAQTDKPEQETGAGNEAPAEPLSESVPAAPVLHTAVHKPWGRYTVLEENTHYLVKRLEVSPRQQLSMQSHEHRSEHWSVTSGRAEVTLDDETFILNPNDFIIIPQGARHRLKNPGDAPLTIIETQIGETLDENDITRYEDDYGRA